MKYIFLLGLFTFIAVLIYWRLRPYIQVARRVFGAVRGVGRMQMPQEPADLSRRRSPSPQQKVPTADEKLVRCASCGTWLPASRAISLRASQASYCSHACLERAADAPRQTRKSAS